MDLLHEGHPGGTRIKALARSLVWWPGIDSDLEGRVKECQQCQLTRHTPARAPLHRWEFPTAPWERLHADFAGPFLGRTFLVVVDAYTKGSTFSHRLLQLPPLLLTNCEVFSPLTVYPRYSSRTTELSSQAVHSKLS